MRFKSIEQMISYIKSAQQESTTPIANETKSIALRITEEEVGSVAEREKANTMYTPTGDILRCIETSVSLNLITLTWKDNGGWTSILDEGKHMYAPEKLEEGGVWDKGTRPAIDFFVYKPPTHFVDKTDKERRNEIPNVYLKFMKGKGISIKRV